MKLSLLIDNISVFFFGGGTVSQIVYLVLSFNTLTSRKLICKNNYECSHLFTKNTNRIANFKTWFPLLECFLNID